MATTDPLIQTTNPKDEPPAIIIAEIRSFSLQIALVRDQISQIIFGQNQIIDETPITLLADGHVLIIRFPELGKKPRRNTRSRNRIDDTHINPKYNQPFVIKNTQRR